MFSARDLSKMFNVDPVVNVPGGTPLPMKQAHMAWEAAPLNYPQAICTVCGALVLNARAYLLRHATWHDVHEDAITHADMDTLRTEDPGE